MTTNREIGIEITAKDKASKVLTGVGVQGKKAVGGLRKAINSLPSATGKALIGFTLLNQSVELFNKWRGIVQQTIGGLVTASLEFRGAADSMKKSLIESGETVGRLQARIGDVLLPVLQGAGEAFGKLINESLIPWINANRKIIATNLAGWMVQISTLAVKGVAAGVLAIVRAWKGWELIVVTTRAAIEKGFQGTLVAIDALVGHMAKVVAVFDLKLGQAIERSRSAIQGLGAEFGRSGDESIENIDRVAKSLEATEKRIDRFKKAGLGFVADLGVKLEETIAGSTIGGWRRVEEETTKGVGKTDKAVKAMSQSLTSHQQIAVDSITQITSTAFDELIDTQKTAEEKLKSVGSSIAQTLIAAMKKVLVSEIAGMITKRLLAKSLGQSELVGRAGLAAAGAYSATVGIPYVGPFLAPAAAAQAEAAVMAFAPQVAALASGGILAGSGPVDSSIALLTPGKERVLSDRQTRAFEQMVASNFGNQPGGQTRAVHQTLTINSAVPPNDTDYKRAARTMAKEQAKLKRRGMVRS